jgi:hypothetical protein
LDRQALQQAGGGDQPEMALGAVDPRIRFQLKNNGKENGLWKNKK